MSQTPSSQGHCLCGRVHLQVQATHSHVGVCHCRMCRRWGGGPLLAVECGADVQFQGEEHITAYASSDWAERGFCRHCGTHLFYRLKADGMYVIPAGLFDAQDTLVLQQEIFVDEQPAFYAFANPTQRLTGEQVFAQFNASQD